MKADVPIIIGVFVVCSLNALGQVRQLSAGFKIIKLSDSSRLYKPNSPPTDKLYYRPLDVDLWYPTETISTDTTASLFDLIHLLEARARFYDDTKNFSGFTEEFLQYLCDNLNCPDYNMFKEIKTESFVNAKPAPGKFPLVIYFAGLNGMSYENYSLFESFAKKGFVVASISSIGRYPGNMSLEMEDLMEQINDGKFTKNYLTENNITFDKIALIGYSWGGLAATLWSMLEPSTVHAVVSLDGSERFHYYGDEDDEKLNRIRFSKVFKPQAIRASYLYLSSDFDLSNLPDSVYNITKFLTVDNKYLTIKNSSHEDFSCLGVSFNKEKLPKHELIQKLTLNYVVDKLTNVKSFEQSISWDEVATDLSPTTLKMRDENQASIKGTILDAKKQTPLPYVNIGIVNSDIGTATDAQGEFQLKFSGVTNNDSLRISCVGFEPKTYYLKSLIAEKSHRPIVIQLQEKRNELKEVVVIDRKLITKTFGNKTTSRFFGGKFASDDYGSEMAIKINGRKVPMYLDKFEVNISYNMEDTASLRLNIYNVKNGSPYENILNENIILRMGNQTGKIELDLSSYNIVVEGDFFIALEWIEGSQNSGIVFSAGFVNKGTYYRKASQGRWKRYPMGVGFNVTGKY